MTESFHGLATLESAVSAIARATTPGEIFRDLLSGTACGAPRAVVFLLREQRWKAWKAAGYGPVLGKAAQTVALSDRDGWLARVASSDERWVVAAGDDDVPQFGQAPAETAIALAVRVGGKAVAIVVAERGSGEQPWHPEALAVLVQTVRLRLEFDLACRRLRAANDASSDAVAEEAPAAAAPVETASQAFVEPASVEPSPSAFSQPAPFEPAPSAFSQPAPFEPAPSVFAEPAPVFTEPVPVDDRPARGMTSTSELDPWHEAVRAPSNPEHDEARRFARLVATDIRLYNEEAVAHGRVDGDLAIRLGDQMQKGRESFERRFPGLGHEGLNILRESFVQVLAGGDGTLIPPY